MNTLLVYVPLESKTKPHKGKHGPVNSLSVADRIADLASPIFITSLARGLAVINAFSGQRPTLTIAQLSYRTGIPRAAVRRCLLTLTSLGYVDRVGNSFALKPKILTLGYSYLSSTPLTIAALPILSLLSRTLKESCSIAVLDEREALYVARSAASCIMSAVLNIGSRLPAYCTALGRVMLAYLPEEELNTYFSEVELKAMTHRTIVSERGLREIFGKIREEGYCIVGEELEVGLVSIAVPLRNASGKIVAALNVAGNVSRIGNKQFIADALPVLFDGARELSLRL